MPVPYLPYLIERSGTPSLPEVIQQIAIVLPGVDVRLDYLSQRKAVLAASIIYALEAHYGDAQTVGNQLALWGAKVRPLTEEELQVLLREREVINPAQPAHPPEQGLDWHLGRVNVDAAWTLLGGRSGILWGATRVGILDTGYTTHPALGFATLAGGNSAPWIDVAQSQTFFTRVDPFASAGPPPANGLAYPADAGWKHGTRMAATIGGYRPNANFYGAAPKVPIVMARVTDSVAIDHAQTSVADGLRYLVDVAKVQVVNCSLGIAFGVPVQALKDAIDHAYDQGVVVVCAAGNYLRDVRVPASFARTIAIGGTTFKNRPWRNGSFGAEVDLSAPSDDIRRASPKDSAGSFSYELGGDGTSYATALTTAAVALWLTKHRASLDAQYPQAWQRVEAVRQLLKASARRPSGWQLGTHGAGILDIGALLASGLPAISPGDKAAAC